MVLLSHAVVVIKSLVVTAAIFGLLSTSHFWTTLVQGFHPTATTIAIPRPTVGAVSKNSWWYYEDDRGGCSWCYPSAPCCCVSRGRRGRRGRRNHIFAMSMEEEEAPPASDANDEDSVSSDEFNEAFETINKEVKKEIRAAAASALVSPLTKETKTSAKEVTQRKQKSNVPSPPVEAPTFAPQNKGKVSVSGKQQREQENDPTTKGKKSAAAASSSPRPKETKTSATEAWAQQQENDTEEVSQQEQQSNLPSPPVVAPNFEAQNQEKGSVAGTQQKEQEQQENDAKKERKKFVVVGAGWGGWGAAKALCESGVDADVIIIDALPDPTGCQPYLSKTGKPVEAGTRGFWKDYPNINALCAELNLDEHKIFTDYTNSSFYSPDGLEATAPVFSNARFPEIPDTIPFLSRLSGMAIPTLPSPLGQVLATFPLFERIPLADRASMVGLLLATVDCLGGDEQVQEQYDRMTAHELFLRFGLSRRLVQDFIEPTLLVGLFKPPQELSALVVMELLYYYALAHVDSFDVRWIRNGTVADSLIAPLAISLMDKYNLTVMGGCRVGQIRLTPPTLPDVSRVESLDYTRLDGSHGTISDIDGIVLALTCRGMQGVVGASPDLARIPALSTAASLKGIDVISVRLWLDRIVPTRTPANVFSRFDELRGAGGTFFMLDQFQHGHEQQLWGKDDPQGSVVACDFYNAGALLPLSDEDIVKTLMEDLLPAAVSAFGRARVVDSWVGRYPGIVSWFAPGTFTKRPALEGVPQSISNLVCAGDWIRMGQREHGAKGLCQERAYVSGLQAGNLILERQQQQQEPTAAAVEPKSTTTLKYRPHPVLPVRPDEKQFQTSMAINRQVMKVLPRFWVR